MVDDWVYPELQGNGSTGEESYWQNIYHFQDSLPKPDPAILELSGALAGMAAKKVTPATGDDQVTTVVTEVTSYHHRDTLRGVVVGFKAGGVEAEALFTGEKALPPTLSEVLKFSITLRCSEVF